jgi:hypothetical protein
MSTTIPPYVVKGDEIEAYFECSQSQTIENLYYRIKGTCELAEHGILRKPNNFAMSDFYDLIKYNVDIAHIYKKNHKIDTE